MRRCKQNDDGAQRAMRAKGVGGKLNDKHLKKHLRNYRRFQEQNCAGYVMRCAAVVIIVAALSTARATATPNGRVDDGSEIVAETARQSLPQMTETATPQDPPLRGLLYPQDSEAREVRSLDGLWDFAPSPSEDSLAGHRNAWYSDVLSKSVKVMQMPVPSSYNDVTTSRALRDHVGAVWYERTFFVPSSWSEQRVFVQFGSVNYAAEVWVNGNLVGKHELGHLPFEAEITWTLFFGGKNRITVAVDNTLLPTSVPQGKVVESTTDNGTAYIQTYTFDFFNYAGIHRPVLLQAKPRVFLEDLTVRTDVVGTDGLLDYRLRVTGTHKGESLAGTIRLFKEDGTSEFEFSFDFDKGDSGFNGYYKVPNAKLWWPRGMHREPAYLYTLEISVWARKGINVTTKPDVYRLPVGIRSLRWTNTSVLINDKPVYMRGFGRHEDSVIRGRGLDIVTMTRDYELLKWVGANSYRTSHYPYSQEVLDMADRQGFLIVDECPAVNVEAYSPELLKQHKVAISELVRRDKNHPSVIMWSIANEPRSQLPGSEDYYRKITLHTRTLDDSRPLTAALNRGSFEDKAGQFLDIIGFNRYNSWYSDTGRLDMIVNKVVDEATGWNDKHDKPVIMFEYGADTMPGLHELPSYVWSEEYQQEMFSRHFVAFDRLREKGFFIGEFIWNFADFRTAETYTRVGGNKKGIFTRTREPKMVAHHVRKRYHALGVELDGVKAPDDLELYVTSYRPDRDEF